jgi:hypothetical protein
MACPLRGEGMKASEQLGFHQVRDEKLCLDQQTFGNGLKSKRRRSHDLTRLPCRRKSKLIHLKPDN